MKLRLLFLLLRSSVLLSGADQLPQLDGRSQQRYEEMQKEADAKEAAAKKERKVAETLPILRIEAGMHTASVVSVKFIV